ECARDGQDQATIDCLYAIKTCSEMSNCSRVIPTGGPGVRLASDLGMDEEGPDNFNQIVDAAPWFGPTSGTVEGESPQFENAAYVVQTECGVTGMKLLIEGKATLPLCPGPQLASVAEKPYMLLHIG